MAKEKNKEPDQKVLPPKGNSRPKYYKRNTPLDDVSIIHSREGKINKRGKDIDRSFDASTQDWYEEEDY